ncbi:YolD-like family protein [Halobacillus shinanisalinarum]|uniref:YolD-like family protein n=1 Tax=Halobacillus shinanisalinarum TaxID=2932258 RepID=A0ABY4H376_9BACI|nr:YolD-like family protein [Halobacillus shinanisalinarum]UOQ93427.1 YolD-like family protein [Halobacillus shinanisalinarum]
MSDHVNDRGTAKWTSLMIPEHVEMLQKMRKEEKRVEKGILDEQQIEENSFALQRAMNDNLLVELKHHNGFDYSYTPVKVKGINPSTKKISCIDQVNKEDITISFDNVFEITFL